MPRFVVFTVLLTLASAELGHAGVLVSRDYLNFGDGLITFDPDTNLEWLDVPLTTNPSIEDIDARLLPTGDLGGDG